MLDRTTLNIVAAILMGVVLAASRLAQAAPVTINNHSFESDVIPRNGNPANVANGTDDFNDNILPTGWADFDDGRNNSVSGDARGLVSHANDSFFHATLTNTPDADANDQSFFTAQRDIFQVLTDTVAANTIYTLTIDIGDRIATGVGGNPGTPIVYLGYGATTQLNYVITMNQGNQPTQVDGDWVTWTGQFTTDAAPAGLGQALRVELTNGTNVGWFDNVRLDASPAGGPTLVPAPAALPAGLALLALTSLRRRRAA